MPHEDGPLYYPTVTTISLGSHTLLDFYKPLGLEEETEKKDRFMFSLLLEPRSLLILQEDMYKVCLHGIKETVQDEINSDSIRNYSRIESTRYSHSSTVERKTRVSLTIRHVSKVSKLNPATLLYKK
jgi:alkylated DNA repair protein alkB family protein 6